MESCLAAGTSPDAVDADGHTPLWLAVKRGHQEVVESLLEAGANPDLPAPNGFFPLHRSASEGFQGITEALLRAGANVDAEHEGTGVTPLFTAISQGRLPSVARLLVAVGRCTVRVVLPYTPYRRVTQSCGDAGVITSSLSDGG